jgi:hypothetical protein
MMGIAEGLSYQEKDGVEGNLILVNIHELTTNCTWAIGSVYVAHRGKAALLNRIKNAVRRQLNNTMRPLLLAGDWNLSFERLTRLVESWNLDLVVARKQGSQSTRFTGNTNTWTNIDHVVCNRSALEYITSYKVMQNVHGSDHWPLSCRYAEVQVKRSDTITKMDPKKCMKEAPAILNSNKFTALNVDDENLATKLLGTITEVSNDLKLMKKSSPSHHKRRLTSKTKKAINTTNVSYRKWKNAVTANQDITITKTLWQEFKEKQLISKKLEIIDARKSFEKFYSTIEEIAEQGCDTDKMWSMVKRVINKNRSSQHTMLLKDPAINQIAQSEERNRELWLEALESTRAEATASRAEAQQQSSLLGCHVGTELDRHDVRWGWFLAFINLPGEP